MFDSNSQNSKGINLVKIDLDAGNQVLLKRVENGVANEIPSLYNECGDPILGVVY